MGKKIDLVEPVPDWFGKRLLALSLAPPRGRHLIYGNPRTWITNDDGAVYAVENIDIIKRYLDALICDENGAALDGGSSILQELSLADSIQLKDALFDFFTEAERAILAKKSTLSSSISAS
jgi:hypothetical protein